MSWLIHCQKLSSLTAGVSFVLFWTICPQSLEESPPCGMHSVQVSGVIKDEVAYRSIDNIIVISGNFTSHSGTLRQGTHPP